MLSDMIQYPIERETFCEIFKDIDWFGEDVETDNFKLWRKWDDFYILHIPSGTLITWYKHLGRCLECNKNLTTEDYKTFASMLFDEMKDLDWIYF